MEEMRNDSAITEDNKQKAGIGKRILAIIGLVIILGLWTGVIICIFINSDKLLAMIVTASIMSLLLYFIVWLRKVFNRS